MRRSSSPSFYIEHRYGELRLGLESEGVKIPMQVRVGDNYRIQSNSELYEVLNDIDVH